jgi:hypothetical protein
LADSVAQSFLGTRIGCARCHNHPLERYTQDDYYHFTAFFSKVALKREDPDKGPTVLSMASSEEKDLKKRLRETEKQIKDASSEARKAPLIAQLNALRSGASFQASSASHAALSSLANDIKPPVGAKFVLDKELATKIAALERQIKDANSEARRAISAGQLTIMQK